MKEKRSLWYLGYVIAFVIVIIIFVTDFPKIVDAALGLLFSAIFSVSHVNIIHQKMLKEDKDYEVNVFDERNIAIREKAGNITNMLNMVLLGTVTVVFIILDYIIPAIIVGVILAIQPFILIAISTHIGKKM